MLLEADAEPDIVGTDGFAPMHWAAKEGHEGLPTLLSDYGAEVDLGDNYDMTPLFISADRQMDKIVTELISIGADPNYGLAEDIIKPRLHLVKGITPLMIGVMPIDKEIHSTFKTVNALLEGGADPYTPDGEGMTIFDRSRCREGAGWLDSNEARSEFHKVCKRLDKAKDELHEKKIMESPVAMLFADEMDKTEDGVQQSWTSYQRLFYDKGFIQIEDLKKIRNEMDLLDLGVRKRSQAFKLMKIIRDTDSDYWETLETEGDVPEMDITKFPRMDRGEYCRTSPSFVTLEKLSDRLDGWVMTGTGNKNEDNIGKVKAKKGSKQYKKTASKDKDEL